MRFGVVESTVVARHCFIAYFTYVFELNFITAKMRYIHDVVILGFIYKLSHTHTLPYGFLKTLSEPDFKKRPPTPHKNYGGSGSWNQTFVVTVI